MKLFSRPQVSRPQWVRLVVLVACSFCAATGALAKSPVKMTKLTGTVDVTAEGPTPLILAGVASHLGKFTAVGEIVFTPGPEEGSRVGAGVVVFQAANGDLLVGAVTWDVGPEVDELRTAEVHFAWRDSVEFSDGTIVRNTGRFVDNRPPGLVIRLTLLERILIAILSR